MTPGVSNSHMSLKGQGRGLDIFWCKYFEEHQR